MENKNIKIKKPLNEEQIDELLGSVVKWIFGKKTKSVMKLAAKDPRFKSALEDYVKGTNEFRKKLKDYYGATDIDAIPRITDLK